MLFYGLVKKFVLFILIIAIAVPIRYGSTNYQYLSLRLLHSTLSIKYSLVADPTRPNLSAEYRAFEDLLRLRPLDNHDPLSDPLVIVKKIRSASSMSIVIPKPSHCQVVKEIFDHDGHTVDTYWVDHYMKKFEKHSEKLILFLHGGGYVLGDVYSYSGIECYLAELFNVTVLHLEYRLSPEHPFPAAVEDTIAVYRTLLRQNMSASQLLLMGDSAGGGLSLLTVQALISHQLSVPRGIIAISPWTDLSTSSASYIRNQKTDVMLSTKSAKWAAAQLLGPNQSESYLSDPLMSPLFGSFEGFPPMYITVGTAEIIEDDSRGVVKKAQEAGVDVTFEEGLHLMHVYPLFFPYYPEAQRTLDNIHRWIQTIFAE